MPLSSNIVAMRDGRILAEGDPASVITEQNMQEVFGLDCRIIDDPVTGTPLVVPGFAGPEAE